jgi:hypothetical protein
VEEYNMLLRLSYFAADGAQKCQTKNQIQTAFNILNPYHYTYLQSSSNITSLVVELSVEYPKREYWALVFLKLGTKWEVRMKTLHMRGENQGPNYYFHPNWSSGEFYPQFRICLTCVLNSAHILYWIKPCKNKILQIFWTNTQFRELVINFHSLYGHGQVGDEAGIREWNQGLKTG